MSTQAGLFESIGEAIRDGRGEDVRALCIRAMRQGIDPLETISHGLTPAIQEVGDRFGRREAFLPELILAANAVMEGLDELKGALATSGRQRQFLGRMLIGTVQGDIHTIGKDIVVALYNANGFEVVDLGADVSSETFVRKVVELQPDIVGMSALLTTTMLNQRATVEALVEAGLRDKVKILVGGSPVTPEWAAEIGADGYAPDAVGAVSLGKRVLEID